MSGEDEGGGLGFLLNRFLLSRVDGKTSLYACMTVVKTDCFTGKESNVKLNRAFPVRRKYDKYTLYCL
jgi:hypothetical protein